MKARSVWRSSTSTIRGFVSGGEWVIIWKARKVDWPVDVGHEEDTGSDNNGGGGGRDRERGQKKGKRRLSNVTSMSSYVCNDIGQKMMHMPRYHSTKPYWGVLIIVIKRVLKPLRSFTDRIIRLGIDVEGNELTLRLPANSYKLISLSSKSLRKVTLKDHWLFPCSKTGEKIGGWSWFYPPDYRLFNEGISWKPCFIVEIAPVLTRWVKFFLNESCRGGDAELSKN